MGNLIVLAIIGITSIWKALQIKYHPEKARAKKPIRLVSIGKRQNQFDFADHPELQGPAFVNLLITGMLFIVSGILGCFIGINTNYLMLFSILIAGILFTIMLQGNTGEATPWRWVLIALVTVGIVLWIWYSNKNNKVEVLPEMVSIEGNYGTNIHYQTIDSVLVIDELPQIRYCKEGRGILSKKGEFRLKDGTNATFYLLGNKAPYLEMYTNLGRIYVNRRTAAETEQLIEELRDKIGDKIKS